MQIFADKLDRCGSEDQQLSQPKNGGGQYFDFKLVTVFSLGHHFSKHKMTKYPQNFGGLAPWPSPGRAYVEDYRL